MNIIVEKKLSDKVPLNSLFAGDLFLHRGFIHLKLYDANTQGASVILKTGVMVTYSANPFVHHILRRDYTFTVKIPQNS